jgi:hypothetical protein
MRPFSVHNAYYDSFIDIIIKYKKIEAITS